MCQRQKLSNLYMDVLTKIDGVEGALCGDGDVEIRVAERLTMVLHNHAPHDPEFLHVSALFGADEEESVVVAACTSASGRIKGVTLMPVPDGFVCTVEMIMAGESCMPTHELLEGVLPRVFDMIECGVTECLTEITLHGILAATDSA